MYVHALPPRKRQKAMAALERGRELHYEERASAREQLAALRAKKLKQLHESYQGPEKAKLIIGTTSRCGNVITTSAIFAELAGASNAGRML
jgi:hypothetical protein